MAARGTKPYLKLASALVAIGAGLFALERYGLSELRSAGVVQLDPTLMALLVLAPVVLVAAGAIIFLMGRMRGL